MMTAWSHLPNAAHIDRIIADLQARPEVWAAAWLAVKSAAGDAAWDAAWLAARDAAGGAVWLAARLAAGDAARLAERGAARLAAGGATWDAAGGTVAALVAWDDCAHLLDTDAEHVRILALLGHLPAVLLLPAAIALNKSMTYST
jgi:hypothetical protein